MSSPVLVLGGGVAGCAAATLLARSGQRVVLFDQHREARHKVCGEFLSVEACDSLKRIGLDPAALGALPVHTVRLNHGSSATEATLPFPALSLTRRRLDAEMLSLAAQAGVELRLGSRVDAVDQSSNAASSHGPQHAPAARSGSFAAKLADGTTHVGATTFLATGKHDVLSQRRAHTGGQRLVAFKQYFRLRPAAHAALAGVIELHLFPGGYAGLQLVETGDANLCLLIEQRRLAALAGWPGVLDHICRHAPTLREHLDGGEPVLDRPLALSHIPYGFLAQPGEGPWRIGDQAAVIPSFTGDGISIALHTARLAVSSFGDGKSPAQYITQLRADLGPSMQRSRALAHILLTPVLREIAAFAASVSPPVLTAMAAATRIRPGALRNLAEREHGSIPIATAYNERG